MLWLEWLTLTTIIALALGQSNKNKDEDRPYKFGFNIQGHQHRKEEKDENGIINGEYGFITADGYYRVTVYATDEKGDFKIISMKNYYVGFPPEDPTTTPAPERLYTERGPPLKFSSGNKDNQPPVQNSPYIGQSKLLTSTTTSTTTTTTAAPSIGKGGLSCSNCFLPTTTKKTPFQKPADVVNPNRGQTFIPGNPPPFQKPTDVVNPNRAQTFIRGNPPGTNSPPGGVQQLGQGPRTNPVRPGQEKAQFIAGQRPTVSGLSQNGINPPIQKTQYNSINPGSEKENKPAGQLFSLGADKPTQPQLRNPFTSGRPLSKTGDDLDDAKKGLTPKSQTQGAVDNGLNPNVFSDDINDLLYRFNYTVGFHGHHEDGYRSGNKKGDYFFDGRDGKERKVEYIANEFGYQPNITFIDLDENDDRRPKEDTEKNYGLKGYEFKWFYRR